MLRIMIICLFFTVSTTSLQAAARVVAAEAPQIEAAAEPGLSKKLQRRVAKFQKKLIKKIEKKKEKEKGSNLWTTLFFIFGLLSLAGGIILGIVVFANPIGGFFYFLAGLLVTAGIVLLMLTGSL